MMTVTDISSFSRCSVWRNSRAATGSSCEVGSSSSSSLGCSSRTEARFSSCFCPPDNSCTGLYSSGSSPNKPAISASLLRITAGG
ncbi:hypothetical protein D3C73_1208610 [compost metagenome]